MKRLLPGPFTFILEANNKVPKVLANRKTVGIRVPDHPIARMIVFELDHPIITTSIKDDEDEIMEYPTDPEIIFERFQHQVDIVIDGGFGGLIPSTVIDATDDNFDIIREGAGEFTL